MANVPNAYATLADIKNELGETSTDATRDAILMGLMEDMSRKIDSALRGRHFYVRSATKYFDVMDPCNVLIDDCLSISALTSDSEGDGTFDGTTYTQGDAGDYLLWPDDSWPKLKLTRAANPTYSFCYGKRYLKAVGLWGYGDGESATPYRSSGLTGTLSDATDTSLTASVDADEVIKTGHTLLIESEQVYVTAVSGTTITVERGINGTTAAAHTAATLYIYKYPRPVSNKCRELVKRAYGDRMPSGKRMEMIGQYQYQNWDAGQIEEDIREALSDFMPPR